MESSAFIDNVEVFYRSMGQGKPLLILHGWGSSYRSWQVVQDKIAAEGFRVVVPDLPGFGKTQAPGVAWGVSDYREFTRKFIRAVLPGEEKIFLLGHSFGGQVAISYAALYGQELKGLILCDAARLSRHKKTRVALFLYLTKFGSFFFEAPLLRFARPWIRGIWYYFTRERDYYRASGTMRETFKKVIGENVAGQLAAIKNKTLILWGEHDEATPLEDAHIIQRGVLGSRLEVLPGAGHAINLERSDEVARYAVNFMRGNF